MTSASPDPRSESAPSDGQLPTWTFEPGHTEAGFRARHMMVTWVHGMFKDIHGDLQLDWAQPLTATFSGRIDATGLWTGQAERDAHLRSADFFDVENHPDITFSGRLTERTGDINFKAEADLTMRGITRRVTMDVAYLGQWKTPFWVGDENKGTITRIGFEATTRINRHDFNISWQDEIPGGGVVVSNEIDLTLDIEAMLDADLDATGAIAFYRGETANDSE
jgi:polyisoprenoid-binding protein YceI